ncbi:MAG TPA: indolepyruvate oxidoreductase subunit beta family protein [Xanthobacteraceae bacterium]|jgi:indolepyruvate ferredoxin oxidoreductase beta subunit|nr:indolepyruvate oxidoreductase subunit beta family protein [Xanthobacteraceae bacterium]
MNDLSGMPAAPTRYTTERPICVAVLAMGGQGGGVLSDWIVELAESQGWHAQSTSVPGVAQRTGSTVYYVEMLPPKDGRAPILSLMPAQGEVDVVLATELMEAGRSILRGLVTPDRSTLIASTHRLFAIAEKDKPGDAIADPAVVMEATEVAAKRVIAFDMESVAIKNGSVISACMFGALAASGTLPFPRESFEAVIKAGGRGIEPSLNAFRAAHDQTIAPPIVPASPVAKPAKRFAPLPDSVGRPDLDLLLTRIRTFPAPLQAMLYAGVKRVTDFQDPAYANEYLDRVTKLYELDKVHGGAVKNFALTATAAKYIAVAMAYDDVIRVAELKTRSHRYQRVLKENMVGEDQVVYTTEYMHPRLEETASTMPALLGRFMETHPGLFGWMFRKGRRVRSGTIHWFLVLYVLSALKPIRRTTLRHKRELMHLDSWLALASDHAAKNYDLAVEIIGARRLVKGYSDTHARGLSKFDRVIGAVPVLAGRDDGADWMRRLRDAALMDEDGIALDGALKTVATL